MKRAVSLFLALSLEAAFIGVPVKAAEPSKTTTITYNYDGTDHQRQMETLGRGLIAVKTDSGVFLSWRLLDGEDSIFGSAQKNVSFKIYRENTAIATVDSVTNYTDKTSGSSYSVAPVIDGKEGEKCGAVSVMNSNYFDIPLKKPDAMSLPKLVGEGKVNYFVNSEGAHLSTWRDENAVWVDYNYTVGDCSCGDLDGDGEYELIVKWDCNAQDNSFGGVTGNVLLDAYKMDGTFLWRVDLGKNIRSGQHYTEFLVYDFDGDGKAELTCKTAPGSKDGKGNYVTKASKNSDIVAMTDEENEKADYRNDGGYILDGDEFFTIFSGTAGEALDTIYYPVQRGSAYIWGDNYGNRVDRFVANVAYLDGVKPYAVYWRGYYFGNNGQQRCGVCGIGFDGAALNCDYCFDTYDTSKISNYKGVNGYETENAKYVGEGNHNIVVADVDDDGKDEVLSGALCLGVNTDNKLRAQWCTFLEHGDASHIGDYDPTHKGLEFFTVHEDNGVNTMSGTAVTVDYGMSVIDAATGELLFHEGASADTGRGVMANVGMGGYYQIWSAKNELQIANGGKSFTRGSKNGLSQNFRIFWDGDLYDNLLDSTNITDWNGSRMVNIFNAAGCVSVNGTKANPGLQADLFGDWREEVVYPTSDNSKLRVFTSTYSTNYKIKTLMHDPIYRSGVATQNSAYNQPPHVGMYLSEESFKPAVSDIVVTAPSKTVYNVGETLDTSDMTVTIKYSDGTEDKASNYVLSGYSSMVVGKQTVTVTYGGVSKNFSVEVKTGFTTNGSGVITGYSGMEKSAVVPESINGEAVNAISDVALKDSGLLDIYVYYNVESFGENAFPDNSTIHCYEGSYAHIYALENDITYELIIRENDYITNTDFSGLEYEGFSLLQSSSLQTAAKGNVIFNVPGRGGGGDRTTGFKLETEGENQYIRGYMSEFSTRNRNAYITISNTPVNVSGADNVLSMDIIFPEDKYGSYIKISDSAGQIDVISKSGLEIEYNTWYNYTLIYHSGKYYRILSDSSGNMISFSLLGDTSADSFVSRIDFMSADNPGRNKSTYAGIDNFKVYTSDAEISDIEFMVYDSAKEPIQGASIVIGGTKLTADASGYAKITLPCGLYDASVTAQGYEENQIKVAAINADISKTVEMETIRIAAEGMKLDKNTAAAAIGGNVSLTPVFTPSNTTIQKVSWSSSDDGVASVKDGIVTGLAVGTAEITAVSEDGSFSDKCVVTVYDTSAYTPVASSIRITNAPSEIYIPLNGENTVEFTAFVYDQNGIAMENPPAISWTSSNTDISVAEGTVSVPSGVNEGNVTISASCEVSGSLSDSVTVALKNIISKFDIYADVTYDELPEGIVQGTTEVSQTIGDITYAAQARAGVGDGFSGFAKGDGYVIAQAGKWASSNRNAYILFDKAPSIYNTDRNYVFETSLYFPSSKAEPKIDVNDGTNTIDIITRDVLPLETQKWYKYQLIYSDGGYTRYIYDDSDNIISSENVTNALTSVKRLDFVGETDSQIYLDNTKYYSTEKAISAITVRVRNENGSAVSGVNVNIGLLRQVTNKFGNAAFDLPAGIYTASVLTENLKGSVKVISTGNDAIYNLDAESGTYTLPTPTPVVTPSPSASPTETQSPSPSPSASPSETPSPSPSDVPIDGTITVAAEKSYFNAGMQRLHIEAQIISGTSEYSGYVAAMAYNDEGELLGIQVIAAQKYRGVFNIEGISDDENIIAKVIWWNSFGSMRPAAPVRQFTPRVVRNSK